MKLDKIKFATLIAYICSSTGRQLDDVDCARIDQLIDIDVSESVQKSMGMEPVLELLAAIRDGRKIDAIRHWRNMSGDTLVDSKRAVESYLRASND